MAGGVMLLLALALVFSNAFSSFNMTVYVPYSALKSGFPDRASFLPQC
jgi:hypothetical protein